LSIDELMNRTSDRYQQITFNAQRTCKAILEASANACAPQWDGIGSGPVHDMRAPYDTWRMVNYLVMEDGAPITTNIHWNDHWLMLPNPPIRSGSEVMLYQMIKGVLMRRKNGQTVAPLTPEDILKMSMKVVCGPDGKAPISAAMLTAHNVIRALARPDKWRGGVITKDDAMYPIFRDILGEQSTEGSGTPSLPELMGVKPGSGFNHAESLFEPGGKDQVFATLPGATGSSDNGGAHYYFWTGSMGYAAVWTGGISRPFGVNEETLSSGASSLGIIHEIETKDAQGQGERGVIEGSNGFEGLEVSRCLLNSFVHPPAPTTAGSPGAADPAPDPAPLPPCPPPPTPVAHKCPWTPDGFTVGACATGFCWDGGPQGTLACKPEKNIPNGRRTDLSDIWCNDGFHMVRDRCTNVPLRCEANGR
ncbi:MAG TPA: hypothetical protein VGY57_14525, partial [Vicinamibacterales bacterium]|nr:hypothetical protein [Vicinamibacterales bacterium]